MPLIQDQSKLIYKNLLILCFHLISCPTLRHTPHTCHLLCRSVPAAASHSSVAAGNTRVLSWYCRLFTLQYLYYTLVLTQSLQQGVSHIKGPSCLLNLELVVIVNMENIVQQGSIKHPQG